MEQGLIALFFAGLTGIPVLAIQYRDDFHKIAYWISWPAMAAWTLVMAWMFLLPAVFDVFRPFIDPSKVEEAYAKKDSLMPSLWLLGECVFFWQYPVLLTIFAKHLRQKD